MLAGVEGFDLPNVRTLFRVFSGTLLRVVPDFWCMVWDVGIFFSLGSLLGVGRCGVS